MSVDLRNPTNFQEYSGTTSSIDHNQYIAKAPTNVNGGDNNSNSNINSNSNSNSDIDLVYQANYSS